MTKLKEIWKKIIRIGIYEDMSFLLRQRIFLSNFIGLLITFVAFLYASIVVIGIRGNLQAGLSLMPVTIFGLMVLLFNRLRLNILSRFILSISCGLTTLFLNLSIKIYNPDQIGLVHYISPRFFIISTLVVPLVLFTTGELVYLILTLFIIISASTWGYVWAHRHYNVWIPDLGISDKAYMEVMTEDFTLVIITLLVVLLFSRFLNYQYEKQNQKLLEEANQRNEQLNTREIYLSQTLAEIEARKETESQQNWISTGFAKFSRFLQETNTNADFYQKFISEIVNYMNGWQGAIYTTEEVMQGDVLLTCKGGYGISIENIADKKYQMGEGLLGKCAQNGKTVFLNQLPEEYANFNTGLSQIKPKSLIIVSLKYQEYQEGVIEVLSYEQFSPYQIEFLEKMAENAAVVLHNLKINQRTKGLLETSKKMFVNLEETQKHWHNKEQIYLEEIDKLRKQNSSINQSSQ